MAGVIFESDRYYVETQKPFDSGTYPLWLCRKVAGDIGDDDEVVAQFAKDEINIAKTACRLISEVRDGHIEDRSEQIANIATQLAAAAIGRGMNPKDAALAALSAARTIVAGSISPSTAAPQTVPLTARRGGPSRPATSCGSTRPRRRGTRRRPDWRRCAGGSTT